MFNRNVSKDAQAIADAIRDFTESQTLAIREATCNQIRTLLIRDGWTRNQPQAGRVFDRVLLTHTGELLERGKDLRFLGLGEAKVYGRAYGPFVRPNDIEWAADGLDCFFDHQKKHYVLNADPDRKYLIEGDRFARPCRLLVGEVWYFEKNDYHCRIHEAPKKVLENFLRYNGFEVVGGEVENG